MKFSDNALKFKPWAVSKIDTANNCQLKFKLQYVDRDAQGNRIKEARIDSPKGRVGNAVHKMIELLLKGMKDEFALRKAAIDSRLTTKEVEMLLEFKPNIFSFLKKLKKYTDVQKVQTTHAEFRFGLDSDLRPVQFFDRNVLFRGVWDLMLVLGKPVVTVLDHKTGEPKMDARGKIEAQNPMQLSSYAVAANSLFPMINDSPLKGVQAGIHYVSTGDIVWDSFIPREKIESELAPWLVGLINDTAEKLDSFEPTKGWLCTFCGYKNHCPLYKK